VTDVEAVQMDSVRASVVLYVHEVDSMVCVCVCARAHTQASVMRAFVKPTEQLFLPVAGKQAQSRFHILDWECFRPCSLSRVSERNGRKLQRIKRRIHLN